MSRGEPVEGHFEYRLFRRVLRCLPIEMQREYGAEMADMFGLRLRARRGRLDRLRLLLREIVGVIRIAATTRRERWLRAAVPSIPVSPGGGKPRREPMRGCWLDLKHALRRMSAAPLVSSAAVLTLGLAIGAVSALFGVVDGVLLRPLPYPDPDRVVWLDHAAPGIRLDDGLGFTSGLYTHYRRRNPAFEEVAVFRRLEVTVSGVGEPERVHAALATPSLFGVLRTVPASGRLFAEDEGRDGDASVVLSHDLRNRIWGGAASVVGSVIRVNGVPLQVVGVLPPGFVPPSPGIELWLPLWIDPESRRFGGFDLQGIGRLLPGVSPDAARRELDARIAALPDSFPGAGPRQVVEDARLAATVVPLKEHVVGSVETTLWLLLGAVGVVLLVACANVANLLLVRAESARRDVAVRLALGAGRGHLVRHFLFESLLLAMIGGALGLGFAAAGVRALVAMAPEGLPRLDQVGFDVRMLFLTVGVTGFVTVMAGALPLLRRAPAVAALRSGGRALAQRRGLRARYVLVAGQVSLATVLLIGAGLLLRSFQELRRVDPGFRPEGVLTFEVGLPQADYPARADAAAFHALLIERLESLPGVERAGAVTCLPLAGWCGGDPLTVEGRPPVAGVIPPVVALKRATRGYFETLGIRLTNGALPQPRDPRQPAVEVVLNQEAARLYFPGEDPIGRRLTPGQRSDGPWYTVAGVVENARVVGLMGEPSPIVYLPLTGLDDNGGKDPYALRYAVRASIPPLTLADAVRREVHALDPRLPVAHVEPMEWLVRRSTARESFTMVLMTVAGLAALILAAVGLFGIVSYVVGRRHREIGLRMALGAAAGEVRWMVLRQAGLVVLAGLVPGFAAALALARMGKVLLFGITAADPWAYGLAGLVLLLVAVAASDLPARRASRTDPAEVLRAD